jgi:hypothetical protein
MFEHNKLRYYLGLVCVVAIRGKFAVSRRSLFCREYLDFSDQGWWGKLYTGSLFETPEEAFNAWERLLPRPV